MRSPSFIFWVLLLVDVSPSGYVKTNEEENMPQIEKYSDMNVFVAVGDGVKTLIVMEGDSVTLNTSVTEIKTYDTISWMFGKECIVEMNEAAGRFFISKGERFRDRLALDNQTGSLTIKNIRTEHTGDYQLHIRSKSETTKRFSVTVRDEVMSVSLMEGDSVTLQTGVAKTERDDQILWKFGNQGVLIANLTYAKWKNVIKLNDHTGDLTIRNIQIQHSGDYDLEINNSTTILHRKFNIAVSDLPENSHWNTTGPVLAAVLVIVIAIAFIICLMVKTGKIEVSWCHKNVTPRTTTPTKREDANRTEKTSSLLNTADSANN